MNSSKLFAAIIGLQAITLASMWLGQPALVSPAEAQMPDAGGQRAQMIEELRGLRAELKAVTAELKATNGRIDKLTGTLDSGKLQVRVSSPDEKNRPAGR